MKKLLVLPLFCFFISSVIIKAEAYQGKVECSSDSIYAQYNCNECFLGGKSNVWKNETNSDQVVSILYPKMHWITGESIENDSASGTEVWKYTSEFESLYSKNLSGYFLKAGEEISWIQQTTSYNSLNSVGEYGENFALLEFQTKTQNIFEEGMDQSSIVESKKCVLYKSTVNKSPYYENEILETDKKSHILLSILLFFFIIIGIILRYKSILRKKK